MLPPTSTTTTPAGDTARNPHRHLRPQPQQPRARQRQPQPQQLPPKLLQLLRQLPKQLQLQQLRPKLLRLRQQLQRLLPKPLRQQPRPQRLPPKLPQQRLPQLRRFVALLLTVILKPVTYRLGQTPETPHLPVSTSATRTRETLNYSPARLMTTV